MSSPLNSSILSHSASLVQQVQEAPLSHISVGVVAAFTVVYLLASFPSSRKAKNEIPRLGGVSLLTAWPFFTKRYDFLKSNFANLKREDNLFKFKVLNHTVVALRGAEARFSFFDSRLLDFQEGYKLLLGGTPSLSDLQEKGDIDSSVSLFNKKLNTILNRKRLDEVLPSLLSDVSVRMLAWGLEGQIDPFEEAYNLIFQMTVRMATCKELSDNLEEVQRVKELFLKRQTSATATALLLPWLPSKAKRDGEAATKELVETLYKYIQERKDAEVPRPSDPIDILLGEGMDAQGMIEFIMGVIFAGVLNTANNACWILVFLCSNKPWLAKVRAEVDALIAQNTDPLSNDPLHRRLSSISAAAWEDSMPSLDVAIRETIRLTLNGTALRRNLAEEWKVEDKSLARGDFVAYSLSDVHLNPDIYTNPMVFDPDRFGPGREEDKKEQFGYLGWGVGRHPCTGMKVAKLELKVLTAMFLAGYEIDIVDKDGKYPTELPSVDYNCLHQAHPIGNQVFLKFKRVVE